MSVEYGVPGAVMATPAAPAYVHPGPTNALAAAASAVESIAAANAGEDSSGSSSRGTRAYVSEKDLEEKKQKRMRRNRESAAQSRNRKKQYVEKLEGDVRQLKAHVNQLSELNYELRREHAKLTGNAEPEHPPLPYEGEGMNATIVEDDPDPHVDVGEEDTAAAEAVAESS